MKFVLPAALCLIWFSATGCATRTDTFDVSVRNETAQPIIVWLTKSGGPEEEGWRSPESIAINYVVEEEPLGGVSVPAGKSATTGKRKGKFLPDSHAVLRVYKGPMTMSEILANGSDSPNRADSVLYPGVNRVSVVDADGKLKVNRLDSPAVAAP